MLPSLCLAGIAALLASTPAPPIGEIVGNLDFREGRGGPRVVAFVGAECPLAELYAGRLAELSAEFLPRGVAFVGLAPNGRDTDEAIARFSQVHRIAFPIVADRGGRDAARLGVTRTPSVVLLDERGAIRYRGRIDDQYQRGARRAEPLRRDLALAIDALLAGRPIEVTETEAIGCPIDASGSDPKLLADTGHGKRLPQAAIPPPRLSLTRGEGVELKPSPLVEEGGVGGGDRAEAFRGPHDGPVRNTYHRDVAPILQRRCVSCHRKGQVAPFALTTYRQASGWAEAIAEAVEERRMPPWHADPAFGTFANDAHLTDREVGTLVDWARGGCPEGEALPGDPPASMPRPTTGSGGWSIPGPDVVFPIPRPFLVPAEGVVDYAEFEVDPGFREDRWVSAAEILPGNRAVVHHCTVFLKPPGASEPGFTPGTLGSFCLAASAPGTLPLVLPTGMAKRVPAGWKLLFVVHYSPNGTAQTDLTRLGLNFAPPLSVKQEVATRLLYDPDLCIPPGAPDHRVEQSWRVTEDLLLLAMFPHMHLRGKSFRYEADYPDGTRETLLFVPRYDFNWEHRYVLATPKRIPAGTTLRCIARYDNSAANPANPDPGATVRTGKQKTDEMFNGYFDVALADQDLTRTSPPSPISFRRAATPVALAILGVALFRGFRNRAGRAVGH